ncbi:MAG TPA: cyclodeaminase/cyclohydrolase family protein [Candidatus Ratteibacteria bacterium]|nr:cyclodeaminase/cyclohydrolase family protein [Candidatus Ratteibacteria bacterium]
MMDCNFLSDSLITYLEEISSKTSIPGGGSVVSLVSSLSCSLLDMVLNYTIGKEKYKKYENKFIDIKSKNQKIKKVLYSYIEKDSKIYKKIKENSKNKEKQQIYLEKSIQMHNEICNYMADLIAFSFFVAKYGNKHLISDSGIVAILSLSSFKGAKLNILINIKYLDENGKNKYLPLMKILNKKEKELEKKVEIIYNYAVEKIGD